MSIRVMPTTSKHGTRTTQTSSILIFIQKTGKISIQLSFSMDGIIFKNLFMIIIFVREAVALFQRLLVWSWIIANGTGVISTPEKSLSEPGCASEM